MEPRLSCPVIKRSGSYSTANCVPNNVTFFVFYKMIYFIPFSTVGLSPEISNKPSEVKSLFKLTFLTGERALCAKQAANNARARGAASRARPRLAFGSLFACGSRVSTRDSPKWRAYWQAVTL